MTRTEPVERVEKEDDAELIRSSYDDPERFAGIFDRYQIRRQCSGLEAGG